MTSNIPEPNLVIYHNPCSDGLAGAWSVYSRFPKAQYRGTTPDFKDPRLLSADNVSGRVVYFVDIMPKRDALVRVCSLAKQVIVLDHHKTNLEIVNGLSTDGMPANLHIVFDMARSGCQIAWQFVNPTEPVPWFLNYIADRDLWTWKMANSKHVNSALFNMGYLANFPALTNLHQCTPNAESSRDLIETTLLPYAKTIEEYEDRVLSNASTCARHVIFHAPDGRQIPVWLGTTLPALRSELGNRLMEKAFADGSLPKMSVTWQYDYAADEWWVSLRSSDTAADVDCSKIAQSLGGGGHPNAAGFTIRAPDNLRTYFKPATN